MGFKKSHSPSSTESIVLLRQKQSKPIPNLVCAMGNCELQHPDHRNNLWFFHGKEINSSLVHGLAL